ncbi:MAG TPA: hypothetical protein VJ927_05610 [Actinomycetota bacterium]|nr:hypothetical protein [Actinomycetota bacterium]
MSKRLLIIGLVLALAAALAVPASAKKKKGPKPYKSETVTVEFGHPVFNGYSGTLVGVTPQEFLNTCAIPSSNGLDAWVFEVPAEYQKIQSLIEASGVGTTDGALLADIDIYLFDDACAAHGLFNNPGTDESGVLAPGTAYIVLHNYVGGPTDLGFTLKPY